MQESFGTMVRRWFAGWLTAPAPSAPARVESAQTLTQAIQVVADQVARTTGNDAWRSAAAQGMPAFTEFLHSAVAASQSAAAATGAFRTAVAAAKTLVAPAAPAAAAAAAAQLAQSQPAVAAGLAISQEARGWTDVALKLVDKGVSLAKSLAGEAKPASETTVPLLTANSSINDDAAAARTVGGAQVAGGGGELVASLPVAKEE